MFMYFKLDFGSARLWSACLKRVWPLKTFSVSRYSIKLGCDPWLLGSLWIWLLTATPEQRYGPIGIPAPKGWIAQLAEHNYVNPEVTGSKSSARQFFLYLIQRENESCHKVFCPPLFVSWITSMIFKEVNKRCRRSGGSWFRRHL